MKPYFLLSLGLPLAAVCALFVSPARSADTGSYSSKTQVKVDSAGNSQSRTVTKASDANGITTTVISEKRTGVSGGDTKSESLAITTIDPPGLGNKSKAETSESMAIKANGSTESDTVTKTSTANGDEEKTITRTSVQVDKKGRRKTKAIREKIRDPKGLMNKTTEKTVETSVQKDDGQLETKRETTVNGVTTEKSDELHPPQQDDEAD